jgi:hypothetical protein
LIEQLDHHGVLARLSVHVVGPAVAVGVALVFLVPAAEHRDDLVVGCSVGEVSGDRVLDELREDGRPVRLDFTDRTVEALVDLRPRSVAIPVDTEDLS